MSVRIALSSVLPLPRKALMIPFDGEWFEILSADVHFV